MNPLIHIFAAPVWLHLMLTFLHTLWQGALITLGLWLALRFMPARRPNLRYGAALASLIVLLLSGFITWAVLDGAAPDENAAGKPSALTAFQETKNARSSGPQSFTNAGHAVSARNFPAPGLAAAIAPAPAWVAWAASLWLIGCFGMSYRLLAHWVDLRRVRQRCLPVMDPILQEAVKRWQGIMRIQLKLRILTGEHIQTPSVFGIVWPTLLLPPALLAGVSVGQLDAIIAHELAHIRRHDYLVNLAQLLLETLLFFNPAVWWINRQIRIEREACCDRLAVETTGQPETYAWSLERWAERTQNPPAVLASAFGAARNPGGPLDRLKRLLISEYQPVIRLPWYSFVGLLVVSLGVLLGLWRGAHLAVGVAAELLTPAQRIERIAEIEKQYGQPALMARGAKAEDQIWIRGTVATADGSAVPDNISVHILSRSGPSSAGYGIDAKQGHFESRVNPGTIYLEVSAPSFAPAFLGPLTAQPQSKLDNLSIVLARGFAGAIKMVNEKDEPLSGVEIKANYAHPASGYTSQTRQTSNDGIAFFEHTATNLLRLQATAAGYEYDERENVGLAPGKEFLWTLKASRPVKGTVISRQSGKPISAAKVILLSREGQFAGNWSQPEYAPVLAITDEQGNFALTTINSKSLYTLLFQAPGYAAEVARGVAAGREDIKIALGPELLIKGKITGNLSQLNADNPTLHVISSFQPRPDYTSLYPLGDIPIDIRDGVGYFVFTNPLPGTVKLSVGGLQKELEVSHPIDDLVLDLTRPERVTAEVNKVQREVNFKVQFRTALPPPNGILKYSYWSDAHHQGHTAQVSLTNGEARVWVPAPGGVSVGSAQMPGYWCESASKPVVPGKGALGMVLRAIPAGAIYGKVINADGSEAGGIMVSVVEVEPSPSRKSIGSLGVTVKDSASADDTPTRFAAQPLPLGGKYALIAHRNQSYVLSEPIKLTETEPIQQTTIRMAAGMEVRGRVVSAEKKPLAGVGVEFGYVSPYSSSFGSGALITDTDGWFTVAGVNPDIPGYYTVSVRGIPEFQPVSSRIDLKKLPLIIVLEPANLNPVNPAKSAKPDPIALLKGVESARLQIPASRLGMRLVWRDRARQTQREQLVEFDGFRRRFAQTNELRGVRSVFDGTQVIRFDGVDSVTIHDPNKQTADYNFDPRLLGITAIYGWGDSLASALPYRNAVKLETIGREAIGGKATWHVRAIDAYNQQIDIWIDDQHDFRVYRYDFATAVMHSTTLSDYEDQKYPWLPSRIETRYTDAQDDFRDERVISLLKSEAPVQYPDTTWTLAGLRPPIGATVADLRISQRIGYWDGAGLSQEAKPGR